MTTCLCKRFTAGNVTEEMIMGVHMKQRENDSSGDEFKVANWRFFNQFFKLSVLSV